jgi:hypothetical protein
MKNIKKLLIYPFSFVVFFGLTANTCLDSVENLTVDVPTTIEDSFEIVVEQEGEFFITKEIDLNNPDIKEYEDRIKAFEVSEMVFDATDNLPEGSGGFENTTFDFFIDTGSDREQTKIQFNGPDVGAKFESFSTQTVLVYAGYIEQYITDRAKTGTGVVRIEIAGYATGPINETINMTIDGVLKASPKQ